MRSLPIILILVLLAIVSLVTAAQARSDVRRLLASYRSLQLETANHRAAIRALVAERARLTTEPAARIATKGSRSVSIERLIDDSRTGRRERLVPPAQAAPRTAAASGSMAHAEMARHDLVSSTQGPTDSADLEAGSSLLNSMTILREGLRADGRAAPSEAEGEQAILDVIAQYVSGLESRNLPALKRVWPTLGGIQERAIRTEFRNARTVQSFFRDPRITIDGDTTTVTGVRQHSLVTRDGQRLSISTKTTMTLRRDGAAWVIERIVHQQDP